jgi:hypothetical protein
MYKYIEFYSFTSFSLPNYSKNIILYLSLVKNCKTLLFDPMYPCQPRGYREFYIVCKTL